MPARKNHGDADDQQLGDVRPKPMDWDCSQSKPFGPGFGTEGRARTPFRAENGSQIPVVKGLTALPSKPGDFQRRVIAMPG